MSPSTSFRRRPGVCPCSGSRSARRSRATSAPPNWKATASRFHSSILLLVILAGCRTGPASFEACLAEAERSLAGGFIAQARERSAACAPLAQNATQRGRQRLLDGEIALRRRELEPARKLLREELPGVSAGTPDALRRKVLLGAASGDAALLLEAAGEAQQAGNQNWQAAALMRLASLQKTEAVQAATLASALQLADASGSALRQAEVRGVYGYNALRRERFSEAVEWFEAALKHAEKEQNLNLLQMLSGNLGWCYYKLGEPEVAIELSERALALCRRIGQTSDERQWLNTIGNARNALGRPSAAIEAYQQALARAREFQETAHVGTLLNNLAATAVDAGRFDDARRYHEEALSAKRNKDDEQSRLFSQLTGLRILIGQGQFDEAARQIRTALESRDLNPTLRRALRLAQAQALAKAGHARDAERHYRGMLAELEQSRLDIGIEERQVSFASTLIGYYRDYIEFLITQGRHAEALAIADSSRWADLNQKLGQASHAPLRQADARQVARRKDAALLVYWLQPGTSYRWTVTAGGVRCDPLPAEAEIDKLAARHTTELQDPLRRTAADLPAARELYRVLLDGALPADYRGRVIVIGDGALHRLNFETLVAGPEPHFWIQDVLLSRAPSLAALAAMEEAPAGNVPLLIGDPLLAGTNFAPLPRAAEELAAIRGEFPGAAVRLLQGGEATPGAYLASHPEQFGYIHFATHGVSSAQRPLDSAIILSASRDGNRLQARKILDQPLRARLVTISACHSAGTRTYRGAGLVGLGWAFLRAGAQAVVAGLWEVNDSASLRLHRFLYHRLQAGDPPAVALRAAKLDLLGSGSTMSQPYYWGPWVLIEGRP